MTTGLHDKKMKIKITVLRESISFSERFLKIRENYHCLLQKIWALDYAGSGVSVYDVNKRHAICLDVYVIMFVST